MCPGREGTREIGISVHHRPSLVHHYGLSAETRSRDAADAHRVNLLAGAFWRLMAFGPRRIRNTLYEHPEHVPSRHESLSGSKPGGVLAD